MADSNGFSKLVPGFEFLQSLARNAGGTLPNMGQWVAPTLNPEEIEKRIEELRTVKFWLEQNGRMLDATIQALEVQRMTLSTLKTMNVQMTDLRDAMMIRSPAPGPAEASSAAPPAEGERPGHPAASMASNAIAAATSAAAAFANAFQFPRGANAPAAAPEAPGPDEAGSGAAPSPASAQHPWVIPGAFRPPAAAPTLDEPTGQKTEAAPEAPTSASTQAAAAPKIPSAIDPLQWWGALTKQFTALAASAVQDGPVAWPSGPAATRGDGSYGAAGTDTAPVKPRGKTRSTPIPTRAANLPANAASRGSSSSTGKRDADRVAGVASNATSRAGTASAKRATRQSPSPRKTASAARKKPASDKS